MIISNTDKYYIDITPVASTPVLMWFLKNGFGKDPGTNYGYLTESNQYFCLFVLFSVKLTLAMSLHDREPSSVRGKNLPFRSRVSRDSKGELLRWEKLSVLEKQWTTQCCSRNLGRIQWYFYGEQEKWNVL